MHTRDYGTASGRGRRTRESFDSEPSEYRAARVATDLGDRNQIREELPLSTRVHELAKELGLKSAELLERIQGWGLDVKASNFASLDPATVDRIRELSAQSASGQGACEPATTSRRRRQHLRRTVRLAGAARSRRARRLRRLPSPRAPRR